MFSEQLWREVYLIDVRYVFKLQLLIELDLQPRFQIMRTEVELDLWVLVSSNRLLLIDNRVREAWVERFVEYALAVAAGAVKVEGKAVI